MRREASLLLLGVSIYKAIRFISHLLNNGNQPVAVDNSSKDDLILSKMVSPPATKYGVFLSFRGEDTRHAFASYLYKELRHKGIYTFMDHDLRKGEQISPVLLRTIEESEISVIIFSENYASSTWCMDELVHILECGEKFGRIVIPIFYKVDPSNIRKQQGSFGNGFDVLNRRFKDNKEKLQRWRNALIQSTSLSGWDSNNIRPEFKLVEAIVEDILSKLNYKSSSHAERLVGIAGHIENIEKLLNGACILGIWGMGGSGKTTLAKALFQELKVQFDAFCFIENVKDKLAKFGLDELQKNCFKELLKDEYISMHDTKSNSVKSRLQDKKILLILDDVDNSVIAEDLTHVCDWFGEGSRIIMTSRDKQVLKNASAFSTYHVSELDFRDAFYLFSLKAFKHHEPCEGYMELAKSVVDYCKGNPLALVVLGCFLYRRGKEEWESALEKLNEVPPKDIVDVLKLSFDGLDDKQQNVFLDLAFFIKEQVHMSLTLITQLYGSSMHIEISVLREKSLISSTCNDDIRMHDLVVKMGLEIDRQQLSSSCKNSVRLWRHEDIRDFFIRDKDIEAIRCLSLDFSKIRRIRWRANNLRKMHNLIYLKVYKSKRRKPSEVIICDHLDYLPEELRFLSWEEYPLPYVPLHFCAENLITLNMGNSNIRQLWNGNQHFPNLEEINVSGSKHLIALPNICHAPKLEKLYMYNCVKLAKSRLVIVKYYLNLEKLWLDKVTMELSVCGKILYSVGRKHVRMQLAEIAELRSLLPFVRKIEWLGSPIEYGDDFNQHYDYDFDYDRDHHHLWWHDDINIVVRMKVRWRNRGERHVVEPLTREMTDDNEREMSNEDPVVTTLMEVEEEEEEKEVITEWRLRYLTLTRVPDSITRWSLLTQLTLRKIDIFEDLFLKSLIPLSCKGIQTVSSGTFFHYIPPSATTIFSVVYCSPTHDSYCFHCYKGNYRLLFPNFDFVVEYLYWSFS